MEIRRAVWSAVLVALIAIAPTAFAQGRLGARELPGARLERVLVAFGRQPANDRETWDRRVCVGLSGVRGRSEAAALSDRIALRVFEQGLEPGRPNCVPNVLVFVTPQAARLAEQLANEYRSMANEGVHGEAWIDQNSLEHFVREEGVVRWWHAPPPSPPRRAQRRSQYMTNVLDPSRLADRTPPPPREGFPRVLIVIDAAQAEGMSLDTLGDMAALAALGQLRQDRLPASVDSLLNRSVPAPEGIVRPPAETLTGWDHERLRTLYAPLASAPPG